MFSNHKGVKLKISKRYMKKSSKYLKNNTLLNNPWFKSKSQKKLENILNSENENMRHTNLWVIANALLRGKFIALKQLYWGKKGLKSILSFLNEKLEKDHV